MKKISPAMVWLLSSLFAPTVFSWGAEGHRITGNMAEEMLSPKARIVVNQLLDGGSLAEAAIFMDVYREALKREIPGSERWHFNNIPVCGDPPTEITCADNNCASAQIPRHFAILADTSKTKAERQQALRFLVHMVGDIHQPLHTADDNDLGGNRKTIQMPGAEFPRNLHAAWDSDIVKLVTRGQTEQNVAKDLIAKYKSRFKEWMRGDVQAWMADSYGIAKRLVYGKLPVFSCGVIDGKATGVFEGKVWPDTPYELPQEYLAGATGVIPVLLARSGARIGGMINAALDPEGAADAKLSPSAGILPNEWPKTNSLREALQRPLPEAATPSPPSVKADGK